MPELREDILTGEQVILAPGRATRPNTFRTEPGDLPARVDTCPFCPGNEEQTPPEVMRTGAGEPDRPGWQVRVVPNKYPIVGEGVRGAHEVVVLSPEHNRSLALVGFNRAREVFRVLRDRARHHAADGARHIQVFINHGQAAGASIEHPHAQLVSLDFVPPFVTEMTRRFAQGGPLLRLAMDEAEECDLVLREEVDALTWSPYAAPSPLFMRIALRDGGHRFDLIDDWSVISISDAVFHALNRLLEVAGDVPYNVVVHSGPVTENPYSWWVDIVPRISVRAGFEFGTGLSVNTLAPEAAAKWMRGAL